MDSHELIKMYESILYTDKEIEEYCKDKIEWANSRKEDWCVDKIRVGVIGVTSSGKSTLINAILGTDILSSAVAPSSGQLVCCTYGVSFSAVIRFENGTKKVLLGKDFSTDKLMEYSDERKNPENTKKVISIELQSPYFEIGKEVLLIDSPGLDAYGLEAHEKITLETLVPTIDVCVYVTTMKTNSDRKAAEILNTVARYDCPLIMVQNMLDSVRPSPSGDKSREQVAMDHYQRLNKIVEQSEIKDKKQVEIVQVSAEYAKRWRMSKYKKMKSSVSKEEYLQSNFDVFTEILIKFLKQQKPRIEYQRIKSIKNSAAGFLQELEPKITSAPVKGNKEFELSNLKKELGAIIRDINTNFTKVVGESNQKADNLINQIENNVNDNNVDEYISKTNEFVNEVGLKILDLIKNVNNFFKATAKKVNIPVRDLLKSPSLDSYRDVKAEKRTEVKEYREKDSGLRGFGRRFRGFFTRDSSDGYHYVKEEYVIIDIEATREKMISRIKDSLNRYGYTYENWVKNSVEASSTRIYKAIEDSEQAFMARRKAEIKQEKIFDLVKKLKMFQKSVIKALAQYTLSEQKRDGGINHNKKQTIISKKINVDEYSSNLINLSKTANKQQHIAIMKSFIIKEKLSAFKAIIIGWDKNCIDELLWQSGIVDSETYDLSKDKMKKIKTKRRKCVFILVNTIQFGAAQKQIQSLNISSFLNQEDFLVWVVQDFQEIINSESVSEALSNMTILNKQIGINDNSKIYLVHVNPIYNIVFLEHQYHSSVTIKEENEMINQLMQKYSVYCNENTIKTIGEMIRRVHVQKG